MAKGSKPTHVLKVFNKTTGYGSRIGVGWQKTDGTIDIVLDDCICLIKNDNMSFHLFPNTANLENRGQYDEEDVESRKKPRKAVTPTANFNE